MAIHVNTDYYWINAPEEYEEIGSELAFIGAVANRLHLTELHNQARQAYSELEKKWNRERQELTKKKSNTNWLGAGSIYLSNSITPWEFNYKMWSAAADVIPIHELEIELQKSLKKLNSNK